MYDLQLFMVLSIQHLVFIYKLLWVRECWLIIIFWVCVRNSHFFSLLCCLLHPWLLFKPTLKVKDIWVIAIKDFSPNFCCHQVVTSCPFFSIQLFTISVCHLWFITEQSNATWNLLSGGYGFKFPNLIYDYRPSMPFWKWFFCITLKLSYFWKHERRLSCKSFFYFFLHRFLTCRSQPLSCSIPEQGAWWPLTRAIV